MRIADELVKSDEKSYLILNAAKSCNVMFVSVIDCRTGMFIYRSRFGPAYKLKAKHLAALSKAIKKSK